MIAAAVLAVALAILRKPTSESRPDAPAAAAIQFSDARRQAGEFIGYYHSIVLSAEQEAIEAEALSAIPAPCCSNVSIATCCCPCNLAKSAWGLARLLIAQQGYSAQQVRATVEDWLRFSNPRGYSGNACYTHGCSRPFDHDGCGGMDEKRIS